MSASAPVASTMELEPFEDDVESTPAIGDWHTHDTLFHVETDRSWEELSDTLAEEWRLEDEGEDMLLLEPVP